MARQRRLDLIITNRSFLEDYLRTYDFQLDGQSLIPHLFTTSGARRIRDRLLSQANECLGIILRKKEESGYFYSIYYSINSEETQSTRLPHSGYLQEEELVSALPTGLKDIHDKFIEKKQQDLLLACERADFEIVRKTFGNWGYNVRPYETQ